MTSAPTTVYAVLLRTDDGEDLARTFNTRALADAYADRYGVPERACVRPMLVEDALPEQVSVYSIYWEVTDPAALEDPTVYADTYDADRLPDDVTAGQVTVADRGQDILRVRGTDRDAVLDAFRGTAHQILADREH